MNQLKEIVRLTIDGAVNDPEGVAELVAREARDVVLFDFVDRSVLLIAKSGDPSSQTRGFDRRNFHLVRSLNKRGKVVLGVFTVKKTVGHTMAQNYWAASPNTTILLYSTCLRLWGSIETDKNVSPTSASLIKKYLAVSPESSETKLIVRPEVSVLPYSDDVRSISSVDATSEDAYDAAYRGVIQKEHDEKKRNDFMISYDVARLFTTGSTSELAEFAKPGHPVDFGAVVRGFKKHPERLEKIRKYKL
jgi:hypothetical protein